MLTIIVLSLHKRHLISCAQNNDVYTVHVNKYDYENNVDTIDHNHVDNKVDVRIVSDDWIMSFSVCGQRRAVFKYFMYLKMYLQMHSFLGI